MAGVIAQFGSVLFGLVYNVLFIVVISVLIIAVFFGYKYYKKSRNKKKSYKQLSCLVVKNDGTWFTDRLGYFEHGDKIDKLHMEKTGHTIPLLPSNCVRGGQCILWNYAPKQYAAVPCYMWGKDPKKFGIEVVNLQMKNFVFLEQRAAISRWAYLKDIMTKWAPWITIVLVGAAMCICVWFLMKFGLNIWQQVTDARLADCQKLLPQISNSIIVPKP